ncbi:glycosyltransferase family 2 protein [Succinimonas amylolytica]|uniref:glycosyltransferase family 2 protein n=1 Tax=Succinimonas amylolytica TaxID=83769 RepID=UPI0003821CCD|nr:glycosyltransferase family 2 protein [Succinimonas amylolytica]
MLLSNEILTGYINEQFNRYGNIKFLEKIWEYGKNKLLVCEFVYKNVRFGIDITPLNDSDKLIHLKLCWRKPYELYRSKLKFERIISTDDIGQYLEDISKRCFDYIDKNAEIMVSVIVPVYNREQTLGRLIKSFQTQSMPKEKFEIIFVDDSSSDKSIDIIHNLSQGLIYSVLKSPIQSGNASQPRNIGLLAARGLYTFFVDSDDYIDNDCIMKSYNMAIHNHSDIVYVKCESTSKSRSLKSRLWNGPNNVKDADIYNDYLLLSFYSFKLFKTYLLTNNTIFFDKSLSVGEDQLFIVNALCYAKKISIIKDKTYYYLTTEDNIEHLSQVKETNDNLYKKWVLCLVNIFNVKDIERKKKLFNCLLFRFVKKYSEHYEKYENSRKETIISVLNLFSKYSELYDDSLIYEDGKEGLVKFLWNRSIVN